MEKQCWITKQASLFWRFLGFFQNLQLRVLHLAVVCMVFMQIVSSGGMKLSARPGTLWYLADSWHILFGTLLLPLACYFTWFSWRSRGLKHFFPYLWGEVEQLIKDIRAALHFRVVGPKTMGLPAVIQGLGFGALFMTVATGFIWFLLWQLHGPYGWDLLDMHRAFAWLLIIYICGHGGMAMLHFILWQRTIAAQEARKMERSQE